MWGGTTGVLLQSGLLSDWGEGSVAGYGGPGEGRPGVSLPASWDYAHFACF